MFQLTVQLLFIMYYGNAAAPAASNGANIFDFFDDFTSGFGTTWSTITSGGSVTQSGTIVTLSNTNAGTVSLSNTHAFPTSSASFILETKHRKAHITGTGFMPQHRVFAGNPFGFDNGYFYTVNVERKPLPRFFGMVHFPGNNVTSRDVDYLIPMANYRRF